MLKRKAMARLIQWRKSDSRRALMVEGARQVGKTYLIREFAAQNYEHVAEINFIETEGAAKAINRSEDSDSVFKNISLYARGEMVPGSTLVFLDEVQECLEVVTMVKFLVDKHPEYDWILSGSLLGTEMKNVRSVPVGYMDSIKMYPLDFEEYCWAAKFPTAIFDEVRHAFAAGISIDESVHNRLLSMFHDYLIVGGMPDAVQAFFDSQNIQVVRGVQSGIINKYREDISKYADNKSRVVKRIFDLIPAELSDQNKRFIVKDVSGDAHLDRYENNFMWLSDAGVALPTYNVREPRPPLLINQNSTLFKLFLSDVGLLTCMCGIKVARDMMEGRRDILYGAIYENFVAQELKCHGFGLYYYKSSKKGEIDFLIETEWNKVVPIEVKSGKTYKRHSALTNVLSTENYAIEKALVLCESNIEACGRVTYAPVYCAEFLRND